MTPDLPDHEKELNKVWQIRSSILPGRSEIFEYKGEKKESVGEGIGPAPWGESCEEGNVPIPWEDSLPAGRSAWMEGEL